MAETLTKLGVVEKSLRNFPFDFFQIKRLSRCATDLSKAAGHVNYKWSPTQQMGMLIYLESFCFYYLYGMVYES